MISSSEISRFDGLRKDFNSLEMICEGQSKVVRRIDSRYCMVILKPSLFSYTANRCSDVPGTDMLRLKASKIFWKVIRESGVNVPVVHVGEDFYVSEIVSAPPVETVVKACQIGTPKHVYSGMENVPTRMGHFFENFSPHDPYVRFDWRNPFPLKDECMPDELANYFIDVQQARKTALLAFTALTSFLDKRSIRLLDICFFIDCEGERLFGEVSPDCMRAKYYGEDLDKDMWRKGKSSFEILDKWSMLLDRIS